MACRMNWRQGYDGSSLDDLQNAMGIGRPSLYHAFGDKRSLFLQCLDCYGHNIVGKCVEKLQTEDNIREALAAFLIQSAKNVSESSLGCMVIALGYRGRSGAARDQLIEDAKAAARLLLSHL